MLELSGARGERALAWRWRRAKPSRYHGMLEVITELSRFYGIVIRMYSEAGVSHHVPHFHAYFQGEAAVFSINPVGQMAGVMEHKQRRLVEAWAELHQEELLMDWALLHSGRAANPIEPLR